mmetsp:Transcript_29330/g.85287  ORF Transcript_29330/g.85287 Transcript_29330/m.85287 type:complete len:277 (-) Transcript_29330:467-1297(-)
MVLMMMVMVMMSLPGITSGGGSSTITTAIASPCCTGGDMPLLRRLLVLLGSHRHGGPRVPLRPRPRQRPLLLQRQRQRQRPSFRCPRPLFQRPRPRHRQRPYQWRKWRRRRQVPWRRCRGVAPVPGGNAPRPALHGQFQVGRVPGPPSPGGIHPLLPPQDPDGRRQRSEHGRPHPRPQRLADALPRLHPLLRRHPVHLRPRCLPALQPLRPHRPRDQAPPRPVHRDGPHGRVRRRPRRPRHLVILRRRFDDHGRGGGPDHRLPGSFWHRRCRRWCR